MSSPSSAIEVATSVLRYPFLRSRMRDACLSWVRPGSPSFVACPTNRSALAPSTDLLRTSTRWVAVSRYCVKTSILESGFAASWLPIVVASKATFGWSSIGA